MKIRLRTCCNLFNKDYLKEILIDVSIFILLFSMLLLFYFFYYHELDTRLFALVIIVLAEMLFLAPIYLFPRKLMIENNEIHYTQYIPRQRSSFTLIITRGFHYTKAFVTIKKITKIEYGQSAVESFFKVCNATIYGEILFVNRKGEPHVLEKYPLSVKIYGIKKNSAIQEELNKLIGAKNEDNCQ